MFSIPKANAQLVARCTYNPVTHKVKFEDFSKFYPDATTEKVHHVL